MNYEYNKADCEYLRVLSKQKFDKVRATWIDVGRWVLPHRIKWLEARSLDNGQRNNQHIVDTTHIDSLRSFVAGFLEGNTSATRPWFRNETDDKEKNLVPINHSWLDLFTQRCLNCLSTSNFYHAAGMFYYDYGTFNTGAYFIDEIRGSLFFHNLIPGSYYVINNGYGEAVVMVREMQLTVKALVDTYGTKDSKGRWDWSNFSERVKKLYEQGTYTQMVDIVQVIKENDHFNPEEPQVLLNKRWIRLTYELGGSEGQAYAEGQDMGLDTGVDPMRPRERNVYLERTASKRKPFIVGASDRNGNFEYGEKGPSTDALGLIKSLNKKAIGKDQALEQMLRPAVQGPANLRKSYITTAPNSYIPLDATSMKPGGGLRQVFEINPAIGAVIQDVGDLRQMVGKHYFADYLLYLTMNPKTRTAAETNAIVQEQQLIIGPNLQSLNFTHNRPVVEFVMDFVLDEDPHLPPPPPDLEGAFMRTNFISVFAQAQRAADLPAIDRYVAMISNVAQIDPRILDKANLDKVADLYEDRLYLPAGINNEQSKVDAQRQQALAQAQRQQALNETLPALAKSAKDLGVSKPQP